MNKLRDTLSGKKTYLLCAGAILTALGLWAGNEINTLEAIKAIFGAFIGVTIRAGIAKTAPPTDSTSEVTPLESHRASSKTGGSLNLILLFVLFATFCFSVLPGCRHAQLETGGAYSRHADRIGAEADYALFLADSAFDLAHTALDTAFRFEERNRDLLFKLSPAIKHALDEIRPVAWSVNQRYLVARASYLASPTSDNLGTLQSALTQMQSLASAAQTAIATKGEPTP